jgi:hypothetical protein
LKKLFFPAVILALLFTSFYLAHRVHSLEPKWVPLVDHGRIPGSLTEKFPPNQCSITMLRLPKGCEIFFEGKKLYLLDATASMESNLKLFDRTFVGKHYSMKSQQELMELLYEVPLPEVGYFLYRPQDLVNYEVYLIGSQNRSKKWDISFEKYRKNKHVFYVLKEKDEQGNVQEKVDIISETTQVKCLGEKCVAYLLSL